WEPFEVDITDAVRPGANSVEVAVSYPPRYKSDDEAGFLEHPVGKQSWYGTTAGIWQSVTLEERHPAHVRELSVRSDATTGTVSITAEVAGDTPAAPAGLAVVRVLRD